MTGLKNNHLIKDLKVRWLLNEESCNSNKNKTHLTGNREKTCKDLLARKPIKLIDQLMSSKLLPLVTLCALDGNAMSLAATGALNDLGIAVVFGITSIAGVGAYIAALSELGNGQLDRKMRVFLSIIVISTVSVVVAAAFGAAIGATFQAMYMRAFGGAAVMCIALMIGGVKVPSPKIVPTPLLLVAVGVVAELVGMFLT